MSRLALASAWLALAAVGSARAADPKDVKAAKIACVQASDKAQTLKSDGKLIDAREQLLACARESCPAPVRKDCTRRLGELEDALPTIVIGAKDAGGKDVIDVKVRIDGVVVLEKLDGKAISVDPGAHTFEFEHAKLPSVKEQVLVQQGVKNRTLTITFPAPPAPPSTEPKASIPLGTWILGGVGVVALGGFAVLGLGARSRANELRTTCAPACASEDVDGLKRRMLLADVSLGVGVLALGGATLVWALSTRGAEPTDPPKPAALQVSITPLAGGGGVWLSGVFR